MRSPITTHILDIAAGKPAQGIKAILSIQEQQGWKKLADGITNVDGRIENLLKSGSEAQIGIYQLVFYPEAYFIKEARSCFYPKISICFELKNPNQHYHIPLLLSGFGYSTYRGS